MIGLFRCWPIKHYAPTAHTPVAYVRHVRHVRRAHHKFAAVKALVWTCVAVGVPLAAAAIPPMFLSPPSGVHSGGGASSRQVASNTDSPWGGSISSYSRDGHPKPIPEPGSAMLLATAVGAFLLRRRK